ncbi:MAG TPA: peptidylprolyl isomerase, partial [Gemmatimonadota bacterium]|nr:peptidylprolyl isomerase [Gemmatimonadota bacterium]
ARAMAIARFGLRGVHHAPATAWLAGLLTSDDPARREAAAYAFGRWSSTEPWVGHAAAVRGALDAAYPFQHGIPGVTAPDGPAAPIHLLAALGRLADPADTERIVRWLEDAVDWRARVAAARALAGRTAEEPARTVLVAALGDLSTHVGVAAAATLSAADSLPPETVHQLALLATQAGNWRVVGEALPAIARDGAEAMVIMFLMALDTRDRGNAFARAKALRALGHGDTRGGFLVLEDEAGWESPLVATAAVEGLAARWGRGSVSAPATPERYYAAFRAALERGDPGTVSAAAEVLADSAFVAMGSVAALLETWRALTAPEDLEPMAAVLSALGAAGDPAARPALEAALDHPDATLRRAAAGALEALMGEPVEVPAAPDPPDRTVDWSALAALGPRPWLVIETEHGRIAVELDAEQAPLTVQTIAGFARDGSYAGVPFHRVVPNFVIQGGDFSRGDGWGGPGFEIRSEFTRLDYERGTLGMASAGKDTEGSQWFVTHSMQPHLDGRYTAFGRVVEGMDVVDRVLEGDRALSATVLPSPRPEP